MPAIKSNPHLTTYDIENFLREAGFNPGGMFEGRLQQGYEVWRQYGEGKEKTRKGGVLRVRSINHPGQIQRKSLERELVDALRDPDNKWGGLWVMVRGANIVIPQEEKYLPGSVEQSKYGRSTKRKAAK